MENEKKERIKEAEIINEKKSKNRIAYVVIVLFILLIIVSFIIALNNVGLLKIDGLKNTTSKKVELQYTETTKTATEGVYITDVSDVVEEVMPSIVAITSKTLVKSGMFGPSYFGQEQYSTGAGSGIIVSKNDSELLILTNNHVIEDAEELSVQFVNEKSVDATVKGTSERRDVAVIAVKLSDLDDDTINSIKIATLGDSTNLKVGNGIIAIGNALGYGQSVTTGVVSALNREVTIDNITTKMIQIDAAINGGNSGGALLNSNGEVIGINSAKYSSSGSSTSASIEGMGFAIPISQALDTIDNLVTKDVRDTVKDSERGSIGIVGEDVNQYASDAYGIPVGILVKSIAEGSAAEKAGIKERDVIVKFDGYSMTTLSELQQKMKYYKAGETVEIVVMRSDGGEYKEMTINVTLGKVNS